MVVLREGNNDFTCMPGRHLGYRQVSQHSVADFLLISKSNSHARIFHQLRVSTDLDLMRTATFMRFVVTCAICLLSLMPGMAQENHPACLPLLPPSKLRWPQQQYRTRPHPLPGLKDSKTLQSPSSSTSAARRIR